MLVVNFRRQYFIFRTLQPQRVNYNQICSFIYSKQICNRLISSCTYCLSVSPNVRPSVPMSDELSLCHCRTMDMRVMCVCVCVCVNMCVCIVMNACFWVCVMCVILSLSFSTYLNVCMSKNKFHTTAGRMQVTKFIYICKHLWKNRQLLLEIHCHAF